MPWTPDQIKTLYVNVYRHVLSCPACGGALTLERSPAPDALGVATCPACDNCHLVAAQNDPLSPQFRNYTDAERKEVITVDRRRRTPVCPIDGAAMDVHVQRSLGLNSNVIVRCRRCAQSVQYVRTHG
jgi:hypothetical protein